MFLFCRIAVFSINVLKDERIVIIAEQRPDCTEEEVSLTLIKWQVSSIITQNLVAIEGVWIKKCIILRWTENLCWNQMHYFSFYKVQNRISSVMASMLASSVVDREFDPQSGQTKDYEIGICCFSTNHTALRRKSKNWLARNQDNVSEWPNMSIHGLF